VAKATRTPDERSEQARKGWATRRARGSYCNDGAMSDEHKRAISEAMRGRKLSKRHRARIGRGRRRAAAARRAS
jgi:hypothetical protein